VVLRCSDQQYSRLHIAYNSNYLLILLLCITLLLPLQLLAKGATRGVDQPELVVKRHKAFTRRMSRLLLNKLEQEGADESDDVSADVCHTVSSCYCQVL
jgi:hypothetical protein